MKECEQYKVWKAKECRYYSEKKFSDDFMKKISKWRIHFICGLEIYFKFLRKKWRKGQKL